MIPNTTNPIAAPVMNPVLPHDAPHDDMPVHDQQAPALSRPDTPGGALAHLPPSHGLHAQVQGAAYAAPHGAGGTAGTPVDPRKAAQAFMDQGVKLLMARDYKGAIAAFREAYESFPSPRILISRASPRSCRPSGRRNSASRSLSRRSSKRPGCRTSRRSTTRSRARAGERRQFAG